MANTLMVAETGENGGIQAVWFWRPGMRGPRPIEAGDVLRKYLPDAEVVGTSRDALMHWLPARDA